MRVLDRLSATGQIYKFEFINPIGTVVFETGSYHPPSATTPAQYHGHTHQKGSGKNPASPLTNEPSPHKQAGKMMMSARTANHSEMIPVFGSKFDHRTSHGSHHRHTISLKTGDGVAQPYVYASVNHPVFKNGALQGRIRVSVDQTELHALFNDTILWLSVVLLSVSALGFGVPSLFYILGNKEVENATKQVEFLTQHDEMTQLVNRKMFVEMVDRLLNNQQNTNTSYALHVIDMDKLKTINDTFGHDAGDDLLRQISDHLRNSFSAKHIISRIGMERSAIRVIGQVP